MLSRVSQFCHTYYDQLPIDALKAVGSSIALSFAFSVTLVTFTTPINQSPNLSRTGLATGISLLAASIYVLITPFFNYIFDNYNKEFNGYQELIKECVNITLTHILVNYATPYKINLLTSISIRESNFIILPINLFKIPLDITVRIGSYFKPTIETPFRQILKNDWGMDQNSWIPTYIVV